MTDPQQLAEARQRIADHVRRRMAQLGVTLTEIEERTARAGTRVSVRTLTRFINPDQEPGWRPRPDTTAPASEALGWPADTIERLFDQPGFQPPHDAPDWTPTDRARLDDLEDQVGELRRRLEDLVNSMQTVERLRRALEDD